MTSRHRIDLFRQVVSSISESCPHPEEVEILVKIDTDDNFITEKNDALKESGIDYTLLVTDRRNGASDLHLFHNMLGSISTGKFLWLVGDDTPLVKEFDWYSKILETEGTFEDNIHCIKCSGEEFFHTNWNTCPIITREWYDVLGCVSPICPIDAYIERITDNVGRLLEISDSHFIIDLGANRLNDEVENDAKKNWKTWQKPLMRTRSYKKQLRNAVEAFVMKVKSHA